MTAIVRRNRNPEQITSITLLRTASLDMISLGKQAACDCKLFVMGLDRDCIKSEPCMGVAAPEANGAMQYDRYR